jgi:hypothetical protein
MTSVGDYDLEHQIGAGASGTVWKAHRRGPVARVVALKRLRAGSGAVDLARIRREATVLTELDHPHIVRVLEVVHDGDGVALAMQFAPGGSLDDLLRARGRLSPGQVVAVAAPVADALASAHRRGVLHGDVKPANVLFTSDGEPLLTDFGVARTLGQITSDQITGTAEYLAPELLDGAQPDPRADVYALGVVCYEALTGRPPFTGPVPLAVARAADAGHHQRLEDLPDVPAPLARVVEQAMGRRPEQRFASADEFARALRTTVSAGDIRVPAPAAVHGPGADDPGASLTTTFGPRPPRPEPAGRPRRRRLPLVAAAVGLAAIGGIALVRGPLASDDEGGDCHRNPSGVGGDDAQQVEGDVDGDGCTVVGVYEQQVLADGSTTMVLSIELAGEPKRFGMGEPGDQLLLGDWDCDGVDTPGLYRVSRGEVQYFNVWPTVADQAYQPDATEPAPGGGQASLVERAGDGDDCDRLVVEAPAQGDSAWTGDEVATAARSRGEYHRGVGVGHH